MLIVISGMISAGKSSLTKIIAEELGTQPFYESVDDNPILPLFYTASPEEIKANRYPFLLQLYFLDTRYTAIKKALVNNNNVLDRHIEEDWYFAKVNHNLGRISNLEFKIYEGLLGNMLEDLKGLPKRSADLNVYLRGSFETILARIAGRGREYELAPELKEYYYTLWSGYDKWLEEKYKSSPVVIIDVDKYDFVNNKEHKREVVEIIKSKLKEIGNIE